MLYISLVFFVVNSSNSIYVFVLLILGVKSKTRHREFQSNVFVILSNLDESGKPKMEVSVLEPLNHASIPYESFRKVFVLSSLALPCLV